MYDRFEFAKGLIRRHKSTKRMTDSAGANPGAPEGYVVPVPLVTTAVLLLLQIGVKSWMRTELYSVTVYQVMVEIVKLLK